MGDPASASYERLKTDSTVVAEATRRSMQGNRGRDTSPELALRHALWAAGLRGYRKNVKTLPGKPDVVYGPARLVIFVNGCYWHQCPKCIRNRKPKTNARYWAAKFESNVARDAENRQKLEALGYRVVTVWECEVRKDLAQAIDKIRSLLVHP